MEVAEIRQKISDHLDQRNLLLLATLTIEHSLLFQIQDMTKFLLQCEEELESIVL